MIGLGVRLGTVATILAKVLAVVLPPAATGTLPAINLELNGSATVYPPSIAISNLDAEYKPGDTLRLYYDSGDTLTGNSYIDHVLTSGDSSSSTLAFGSLFSGITTGIHIFRMEGRRGDKISVLGNEIIHGDAAAPTLISYNANAVENQLVLDTLIFSEKVSSVAITGLDGGLLKSNTTLPATTLNIVRADGAVLDYETKSSYSYIITVKDRSGNKSSGITRTCSVIDQDEVPNDFSQAPKTGLPQNIEVEFDQIIVSGLGTNVTVPVYVQGSGIQIAKNGGPLSTASLTAVNGTIIRVVVHTPSAANATNAPILHIGDAQAVFSVTTQAAPNQISHVPLATTNESSGFGSSHTFAQTLVVPTSGYVLMQVWSAAGRNPDALFASSSSGTITLNRIGPANVFDVWGAALTPGTYTISMNTSGPGFAQVAFVAYLSKGAAGTSIGQVQNVSYGYHNGTPTFPTVQVVPDLAEAIVFIASENPGGSTATTQMLNRTFFACSNPFGATEYLYVGTMLANGIPGISCSSVNGADCGTAITMIKP